MIFKSIPTEISIKKLKTNPRLCKFQKHSMTFGLHNKKFYPDHSNRLRNFQEHNPTHPNLVLSPKWREKDPINS